MADIEEVSPTLQAKLHVHLQRLSEQQRQELLRRLDPEGTALEDERRVEPRWPYRSANVAMVLEQPGGRRLQCLVLCRNLSTRGMAFIHGAFVYPGSRVRFVLPRPGQGHHLVHGDVVGCRHIEGPLHEVSVQFDEPIAPQEFVSVERLMEGLPAEAARLRRIRGQVLFVGTRLPLFKTLARALAPTSIGPALAPDVAGICCCSISITTSWTWSMPSTRCGAMRSTCR
ncbi:MAG: PilZ domain-containing protein [Planctomycetota bacterium]